MAVVASRTSLIGCCNKQHQEEELFNCIIFGRYLSQSHERLFAARFSKVNSLSNKPHSGQQSTMQGSYFHHLFLLCIWLLVKAPQLGCDGKEDGALADQCWQKCRLILGGFYSAEACYRECLKKGQDNCFEFLESKSFLPRTHVKIHLVARGPKFYYAKISWNISSDITRNWTRGYLVLYALQINQDTLANLHCRREHEMNTSFTGFYFKNENLTQSSALYVMVFSLSQERENLELPYDAWKTIRFPEATPLPTVRTDTIIQDSWTSSSSLPISAIVVMCVTIAVVVVAIVIWWRFVDKKTTKEDVALSDSGFKFDAFIIYSTTDETWVKKKLLSILEKKHNIKCCIHYRDFLPGVPFVENMAQSVYNSRKTIAVVSKSFLSSNYCNHELNIALHRLVERGDNSVIVIKLDDVEDSKLPIELQFRSYIDFTKATDKKTWEYKLVNSFIDERC
ncbi:uncharacterized protein [Acropora muricata]|uniref:uncharacterized protein isoform X3 n=1 Tax=Acropora muricata TaxID=159855 RepID=UPI0034E4F667